AYKVAIENAKENKPTLMALSRQGLPNLAGSTIEKATKGAYVLSCGYAPEELDIILIGTGSEVQLCVGAAKQLIVEGKKVRVVSMPSWELFEAQDEAYRESVLPAVVTKRLSVEAMSNFGWHKYTGCDGGSVSIERYGASAPGAVVMEKFGFTVENVVAKAKEIIG
ncbi:MAG: transketolase C-terminal domain-containing protein, partial [Cyanobacteria bacterium J06621_8]